MYVCVCNALREKDFREAARENPEATVEQVFAALYAEVDCGSCLVFARHILEEEREKAKTPHSTAPTPV